MDNKSHIGTLGRIVLLVVLFSLLPGCSPKITEKVVTVTVTEVRDSTAWRDTTIYVPIPLESDQAIVHVGDTSHRETSVAESDAWVGNDGMIHHSLRNKAGARISYNLKLPERWIYTGFTNTKEHEHSIIKEVKVEKPLSWWQKFRIRAFWWLLGGLILSFGWIFRKPLIYTLKLWLSYRNSGYATLYEQGIHKVGRDQCSETLCQED